MAVITAQLLFVGGMLVLGAIEGHGYSASRHDMSDLGALTAHHATASRLIVGIAGAVTVRVRQQTQVVRRLAVVVVSPDQVGQAQCNHGLPQAVLHRLAKAKVSGVRQGRHEFGDPDPSRVGPYRHDSSLGYFLPRRNSEVAVVMLGKGCLRS
jgi:hypothetical protein